MGRLAFLADEHVNRAYVSVLRSNGYRVESVGSEREPGTTVETVLVHGLKEKLVLLTNDDSVELAARREHAGTIFYQLYMDTRRERSFERSAESIATCRSRRSRITSSGSKTGCDVPSRPEPTEPATPDPELHRWNCVREDESHRDPNASSHTVSIRVNKSRSRYRTTHL